MDKVSILKNLLNLYKQLLNLMLTQKTDKRQIVFNTAKSCLGKPMSPEHKDYGCAEALNGVINLAIGHPLGGGASTYLLYQALKTSSHYQAITTPLPGDVIISPSGYGSGKIANGHTGIVSDNNKVMSNNSDTLLWDEHISLDHWQDYYGKQGGYPIYYFRVLS